jgi:predicted phosphodiesterase
MSKLRVNLISDLHLECGYLSLPGGDVLILAGDICESKNLRLDFRLNSTPATQHGVAGEFVFQDFFWRECAKYNRVFYVLGNHESYGSKLQNTYDELKSMMPSNVTLLENQSEEYEGVVFLGATMWTDLNNGDPLTALHLKTAMNDYRYITYHDRAKNVYYKLTPYDTARIHHNTVDYLREELARHRDKPCVVTTHHAPSYHSIHEVYRSDKSMNGGYASDLEDFILDNPNIVVWNHGHTHNLFDYKIGDTRVLCNPRGYSHEDGNGFDVNFTFEV